MTRATPKMSKIALAVTSTLSIMVSGCTSPLTYKEQTANVDAVSVHTNIDRDSFEKIDLAQLLLHYAPNNKQTANTGASADKSKTEPVDNITAARIFNQAALSNPEAAKAARNALQERMLAASTQRCNAFKSNLQRTFASTNFGLGLASTISGTLGALVSGEAASNWAGASAIFSGARAEFNQEYMANLAAYVVIDGIESRQREVYAQIQKQGQEKSYLQYPVEAAIKDALYYHGLCSVITGFQVAQSSIREVEEPGLQRSIKTLAKLRIAQNVARDGQSSETILTEARNLAKLDTLLAGSSLDIKEGDSPEGSSVGDTLFALKDKVDSTDKLLKGTLTEIDKELKTHETLYGNLTQAGGIAGAFEEGNKLVTLVSGCRSKYQALLIEEQNSVKELPKASSEAELTKAKQTAQRQREQILAVFESVVNGYVSAARVRMAEWQTKKAQAIQTETDTTKNPGDRAALIASITKPIALGEESVESLKTLCKGN